MLDVEATFSPHPDASPATRSTLAGLLGDLPAATPVPDDPPPPAAPPSDTADSRPVTPRRPLRFTSARAAGESAHITLSVPNIFDGVFDAEDRLTDPRLLRSRARARSLLAAREAALSEAERNLWHDDGLSEAPAPQPAAPEASPARAGRRVRHLTAADLGPAAHRSRPDIHDPLRDRLIDIRAALYAADPEAGTQDAPRKDLPERLTAQVLNVTLLTVALPVGATVATITLLRGEDLALSARAVALVGAITGFLQLVPLPHV